MSEQVNNPTPVVDKQPQVIPIEPVKVDINEDVGVCAACGDTVFKKFLDRDSVCNLCQIGASLGKGIASDKQGKKETYPIAELDGKHSVIELKPCKQCKEMFTKASLSVDGLCWPCFLKEDATNPGSTTPKLCKGCNAAFLFGIDDDGLCLSCAATNKQKSFADVALSIDGANQQGKIIIPSGNDIDRGSITVSRPSNVQVVHYSRRSLISGDFSDDVVLSDEVKNDIAGFIKASNGSYEISMMGEISRVGNDIHLIKVHLLKQTGHGASTEIDDDSLAALIGADSERAMRIKCWIHTHPNMNCFWSNTDQNTIDRMVSDWMLSIVISTTGGNIKEAMARIDYKFPRATIDKIYVSGLVKEVVQEEKYKAAIDANVTAPKPAVYIPGSYKVYSFPQPFNKEKRIKKLLKKLMKKYRNDHKKPITGMNADDHFELFGE